VSSPNSYRFVWTDAAINRDTNNLVSAALELFRNGNVSVTTNGVAAHLPRELPFEHHGYGQDDEWVAANFTNATEILAVGYPQWVDAQVGEGLTNGLFKLSVTVTDDPPETTSLTVGNLSVAVTNAGEYVFLLEKGPDSSDHVVAHEIGHALGMEDCYIANKRFNPPINIAGMGDPISSQMFDDKGHDWGLESSRGFYPVHETIATTLPQMVMYGVDAGGSHDIPSGSVYSLRRNAKASNQTFSSKVGANFIKVDITEVYSR
jgi:hypothetical protein